MSDTTVRNLDAVILGTGEFLFSPGAATLAAAQAAGFISFGNILALSPKPTIEKLQHTGAYRGRLREDKTYVTKTGLDYTLKCDEFDQTKLSIALMGTAGAVLTQSAISQASADVWAFTTTPAVAGRWYPVLKSGVQVREITAILASPDTALTSVTADASTNFLTKNTHGLVNGDKVLVGGTPPAPLALTTAYYVVNKTDNTFQLSATAGGTAIDLTDAGASITITKDLLDEGTDYFVDEKCGNVRFAAVQSTSLTAKICASAISAGDNASLKSITPLADAIQSGWGILRIFDDAHPNTLVYEHTDFSCDVSMDSMNDMDGKNLGELTLNVKVTDTVGTVWCAE